jgi:hypothetical protein
MMPNRILGSVEQNWKLSSTDMLERIPVIGGHYQAANMRGNGSLGRLGIVVINCSYR